MSTLVNGCRNGSRQVFHRNNGSLPLYHSDYKTLSINAFITATDVASLRNSPSARGSLTLSPKASYSNRSSRKLYSLLTSLHNTGGYSHTFGALDPVQVIQMAPHLSSIYISGWQCSSTASSTNEPGPDFADYTMNTVPLKCKLISSVRCNRFYDIEE